MAIRRMFSSRVTESTRFVKMPATSQNLYFHLGMKADDDGVVEAYPVMCIIGASEDDLRVLVSKGFVTILNEDMVAFLNDWLENNNIRKDRKTDSIYKELLLKVIPEVELKEPKKAIDNQVSDICQPNDGIGKDRLGKDRLSKDSNNNTSKIVTCENRESINYQLIADMYNDTCVSFPKLTKLSDSRKKAIKARLIVYTVDDFKKMFEMAELSDFLKGKNERNWSATFDWLIKDSNMVKVLDGNYQSKDYRSIPTSDINKPYHNILDDFDFSNYQPEEDVFAPRDGEGEK